jgi:hypothetical protein
MFPISSFPSWPFKFAVVSGRSIEVSGESAERLLKRGDRHDQHNLQSRYAPKPTVGDPAMSHDQGLQTWPASTYQRTTGRPVVPILIQVPAVPALMGRAGRTSMGVRVRTGTSVRQQRRRRRLRREVRVAGYAMMLMAPMMYAPLAMWGERSSNEPRAVEPGSDCPELTTALHPPVISISIEPVAGSSCSEAEPPVVFPGYLLPDNESEGPAHAGS